MPGRFLRLIGTSLGLYMVGMSVWPTIVMLPPNVFVSFLVASALLGLSLYYLHLFVPQIALGPEGGQGRAQQQTGPDRAHASFREPIVALPGLVIFFYNSAQAYLFPVIMVHVDLSYGFTSTESGYVVSLVAATPSLYLLFNLCIVPRVRSRFQFGGRRADGDVTATSTRKTDGENTRPGRGAYYFNAGLAMLFFLWLSSWQFYLSSR